MGANGPNHTQGPWSWGEDGAAIYDSRAHRRLASLAPLASVVNSQTSKEAAKAQRIADARIIAAAPEMLAMLELIRDELHEYADVEGDSEHLRPNWAMELETRIERLLAKVSP